MTEPIDTKAIRKRLAVATSMDKKTLMDIGLVLAEVERLREDAIEIFRVLAEDIATWSDSVFGDREGNPANNINHLMREVVELQEQPLDVAEYADCFMLIVDSARIARISSDELLKATRKKLEINKHRAWGGPDANGVREHVRATLAENPK